MNKIFFTAIFCFLLNFFYCQGFQVSGEFRFPTSKYSAEFLENSNFNVFYKVSFVKDIKNPELKSEAYCLLEIGDNYSKFTDINLLKKDSLNLLFSKKETVGAAEMNIYGNYYVVFGKNLLKNLKQRKYSLQERFRINYQYEEETPKMNWELVAGKAKILGYDCKKAQLNYRGRIYTAWYTQEIAVSNGPYIFGGLPGLILKIEDQKKEYVFEAAGINKTPKKIYWRNDGNIKGISRNDFRKLEKTYYDNPGFFVQAKAFDSNGGEITPKFPPRPYNPVELD